MAKKPGAIDLNLAEASPPRGTSAGVIRPTPGLGGGRDQNLSSPTNQRAQVIHAQRNVMHTTGALPSTNVSPSSQKANTMQVTSPRTKSSNGSPKTRKNKPPKVDDVMAGAMELIASIESENAQQNQPSAEALPYNLPPYPKAVPSRENTGDQRSSFAQQNQQSSKPQRQSPRARKQREPMIMNTTEMYTAKNNDVSRSLSGLNC